jgi:RNA polymerase sigma-70 factor, ECF subfamily
VQAEPTFPAAACTYDADEDRALLQRYRNGDAQAFTELVVRYQRPVYRAAFWILHRSEDADDIAQTVFLKAAERIADYDPRYKFFSWIYRIAVNEALNVQRRRGHEEELDEDAELPDDGRAGPESQFGEQQRARALRVALLKLTANDRLIITMRHFQECSYAEMAEVLAVEEKTVKSRLFEARQRLRALLGDLEGPRRGRH